MKSRVLKSEIRRKAVTPAVCFDHNLCAFDIFRLVNLSLEYGNTDASSFAYVWFAMNLQDFNKRTVRIISS